MSFVPFSKPIEKDYFKIMKDKLSIKGSRLVVVWDWENLGNITQLFILKNKKRASSYAVKELPKEVVKDFLNSYHLQGMCRNTAICLGLVDEQQKIFDVMTFGKPRYNKNYEWELLRLCTKEDYVIYGGAQKLFNYFVVTYEPHSIVSYCDCSKFSGTVYTALSFKQFNSTPSIHWVRLNPFTHYTDNLLRYKGADSLLGTSFGKGTSNVEIVKGAGFLPVPDCGQDTYVWTAQL